jgi:hypothetical protein
LVIFSNSSCTKERTIGIDSHKSLTNIIENNTPCAGIKLTTLIA